ncbi:MAG: hypothetical protein OEY96_13880 [Gammaproteobacteria bacterium]|nr:hypothetical protein [Gammaproteobacteria bacterium]
MKFIKTILIIGILVTSTQSFSKEFDCQALYNEAKLIEKSEQSLSQFKLNIQTYIKSGCDSKIDLNSFLNLFYQWLDFINTVKTVQFIDEYIDSVYLMSTLTDGFLTTTFYETLSIKLVKDPEFFVIFYKAYFNRYYTTDEDSKISMIIMATIEEEPCQFYSKALQGLAKVSDSRYEETITEIKDTIIKESQSEYDKCDQDEINKSANGG